MSELPYLFSIAASRKSFEELYLNFGSIDKFPQIQKQKYWSAGQEKIIAEECIRLHFIENISSNVAKRFGYLPFFINLNIADICSAASASVAMFPLNNAMNNNKPVLAHLWLFKGLDCADSDSSVILEGSECISSEYKIFITRSDGKTTEIIHGRSWQLAYKLAEYAIKKDSFKVKQELACKWIITGRVHHKNNSVEYVKLGNKLQLPLGNHIKWLLPLDSMKDITPEQQQNLVIRAVDDLESAVNHITGEGSRSITRSQLPVKIDELHMLVGKNIKAQIASAILTLPKKIVLWHSESQEYSLEPAGEIKAVIPELISTVVEIELREVPDRNIQKAEKILRYYFDECSSRKILFNVTSGNRLMSYAVQTIARLFPRIDLIYRELGESEQHKFILLNYREMPPYAGAVIGYLSEELQNINTDFLYNSDSYKCADDFLKQLTT
jgi:hypothetical protein